MQMQPTPAAVKDSAPADFVLTNAKVYTVDPHKPWAQAVAVRDGRIVHVGDTAAVQAYVGADTKVVDAAGRLVLPGFVESHWHFETTAFAFQAFVNYDDPQKVLAALREYVESHPDEPAITGMGWVQATIPPALLRRRRSTRSARIAPCACCRPISIRCG